MSTENFEPDWASPPGKTIGAILRKQSLSPAELAHRTEQNLDEVLALLDGRRTITLSIARRLSDVLGGSVEFWMARDYRYRETLRKLEVSHNDWLAELPVNEMSKFGWLATTPSEIVGACLRFFGVPSVSAWRSSYGDLLNTTAFRASKSYASKPGAVAAWLRAGEHQAAAIDCANWDPEGFRKALRKIRALTRYKDPDRFVPPLRELCAQQGVAVTIVRAPTGCRASGATRFIDPRKAILQLSFRFLTDDQFWFTFFHEASHLLLHGPGRFFLEESDAPITVQETEANEFAARILIPASAEAEMLQLPRNSKAVIKFAGSIGIAPGIVVGQLQHRGKLRPADLNKLKRRYAWDESSAIRGKT